MSSYLSCGVCATLAPDAGAWKAGELAGPCPPWVIAAGAGDLADPSGGCQDSALVAAGWPGPVSSGQVMTFAVPVITLPAKVRRSGAVQADGWRPDQVRLGMLETVLGDGVIEELRDQAGRRRAGDATGTAAPDVAAVHHADRGRDGLAV